MKKIILFFLLFFKLESIQSSIHSSDLCFISEKKCKGNYNLRNQYHVTCEGVCHGKYSYHCGTDRCSINKQLCEQHQNMLNSLVFFFRSVRYKSEKEKYKIFNQTIKKCTIASNDWQLSEICLNGQNCYEKKEIAMRGEYVYSLKKRECPCRPPFGFHCGKYCALDDKVCSFFASTKFAKQNSTHLLGLKGCGNDYVIVKKNFSFL